MTRERARLARKTRVVAAIVVLSNVLGNASLSRGLHGRGSLAWFELLFSPWVGVGVGLLVVWMLLRMALLSWADLSYVLPVTAAGYVLTAIAGHFLLAERLSAGRWAATALIVAGVLLVGATDPTTQERHS